MFFFLTTYQPQFNLISNLRLDIQEIKIENNLVLNSEEIKNKLNFLYNENLFFLNIKEIEKNLKSFSFIESFSIKKVYPNKLTIKIREKKPIAILQNKKEKFYISDKGNLIDFINQDIYKELPLIFGKPVNFYSFYKNLLNIEFPFQAIKSFYFYESGRWDLIMEDDRVIKLPIEDYLISLKNYLELKKNNTINNYKIFDYRIKDQLILN